VAGRSCVKNDPAKVAKKSARQHCLQLPKVLQTKNPGAPLPRTSSGVCRMLCDIRFPTQLGLYLPINIKMTLTMFSSTIFSALLLLFQPNGQPQAAPQLQTSNFELQTSNFKLQTSNFEPQTISHMAWDTLLQRYVTAAGKVDYKSLKADKKALNAYCQMLADNPVQDDWSRNEKMAYWINVYNAFTVKLIVDNYPAKSILNFDGGKTWDVKRIQIGGKKYSLNQIENEILRPQFNDPRIHFAINCAAKSCPPLHNHAYTADNLEASLEAGAKGFVNDPKYNTLTASKAQVSKVFEWYKEDFGDLKKFLNKYADNPLKASAAVTFQEYNWELNE